MYVYIYTHGDELVTEESVTKNSRSLSRIKATHGSKMLRKFKK